MPRPKLESGASKTIATTVYDLIRRDILRGELKPGDRLRVESLRVRYESSGSPVREALNRLSANALVTSTENRGFYVPKVSRTELLELYQTREWLESLAITEAIQQGDSRWEEQVVLAQHRLSQTPRFTDDEGAVTSSEWEAIHRAFHMALISSCGSSWLIRFCEQLHDHADRYRQLAVTVAPEQRKSGDEHSAIADACIRRNAKSAVDLLVAHYNRTRDIILNAQPSVLEIDGADLKSKKDAQS